MKMSGVIRLAGVLAAALAVVGMIAAVMASSKWEERVGGAKKVRVIREAEITVDGTTEFRTLPLRIGSLAPGTSVTAAYTIESDGNSCIQVRSAFAPLEVEIDGRTVYRFGAKGSRPSFMKDPGTMIRWIQVEEAGRHRVTLHFTSPNSRTALVVSAILLSNQSGLLRYYMNHMGPAMSESAVLVVAGILLAFLSLFVIPLEKQGALLLWVGLFALSTGVWGVSGCDMALLYLNDPNLMYVLSYLSFFVMLLPLERFLMDSIGFCHPLPFRILNDTLLGASAAAIILQLVGIVMFTESVWFFQLFLIVSLLSFTAGIVYEAVRRRNRTALAMLVPMVILLTASLLELHFYRKSVGYSDSRYFLTGAVVFCFCMSIVGAFSIRSSVLIRRREQVQEYEIFLLQRELTEQQKYQAAVLQQEERLRRQRHDFRHQLTVLKEYSLKGEKEELNRFIDLMIKSIPKNRDVRYCENRAVNAVISYYASACSEMGVQPEIRVTVPPHLTTVQERDLSVLFGNLLENAMEACQRMQDTGKRFIRLTSVMHLNTLVIRMENSYSGRLRRWGRFYLSGKRDEVGIGLTSIASIADAAGGNASFYPEGDVFVSDVYLTLETEEN